MTADEIKKQRLEEFKNKHPVDKSSPEWKEYCDGVDEFDSYFPKGTPYFAPVSAADEFDEDWVGYRKYVNEHYNDDSSKMTDEEMAMFFKLKAQ
ncbi:MAG: hypothetical protein AB2L14_19955 [Candidatus Xenobiia bacterium LiM19]